MKPKAAVSPLLVSFLLIGLIPGCGSDDKGTNVVQVAEPFDSGDLVLLGSYAHTFPNAGTFPYRCRHHSMSSTVTVSVGAADSALVHITDFTFSAATPIKPGGYVRWLNDVYTVHTATRP